MKCPSCGKKMKKSFCTKCGYNPNGNTLPNGSKVNYYTYDPNNPNVVYPLTVSGVAQANPSAKAPLTKKEAKLAAKKAKLDLKALPKKERKIAKRAAKREAEVAASVLPPKNKFSRLFALVVAVLSVMALAVLSYQIVVDLYYIVNDLHPTFETTGLLASITAMMNSGSTLLGIIPAFPIGGRTGFAYNLSIYLFAAGTIIALVYALGAVISKEKAPKRLRKALFFLGMGALAYVVAMAVLLGRGDIIITEEILSEVNLMQVAGYYVDTNALLLAVVGLVLSLFFKLFKKSK